MEVDLVKQLATLISLNHYSFRIGKSTIILGTSLLVQ